MYFSQIFKGSDSYHPVYSEEAETLADGTCPDTELAQAAAGSTHTPNRNLSLTWSLCFVLCNNGPAALLSPLAVQGEAGIR